MIRGLSQRPRSIPCKYFYDRRGSELFDQITTLDEYYPTRAETALLRANARAMADRLGPKVDLVELGSGSSIKTRILLDALRAPARYVPVDISGEHLRATARSLVAAYPDLRIEPVVADYAAPVVIERLKGARRAVFFPGSSIGNFEPEEAIAFLARARGLAGSGGVVLVGVDLPKDRAVLERAYADALGVTAAFNLNVLTRIVRELRGELDVSGFEHVAEWQESEARIEMRLRVTRSQTIRVGGRSFELARGESIVTEHCYKHSVERFRALALAASLSPGPVWLDPDQLVSMHWLEA